MSELEDRYGARWYDVLQKRVLDILRNEVRTRHRIAANEEIRRLEPAIRARFQDFTALGRSLELTTFAEIEELLSLSRKDVFKVCGRDDVYRVVNGYDPDAVRPTQQIMDAAVPYNRPATTKTKHAPQEYVSLAKEGLNNTEIAERLGDVIRLPQHVGLDEIVLPRDDLRASPIAPGARQRTGRDLRIF
jgi:hypothetical protein